MQKISIVVVTYNFEDIILECLRSIESQGYREIEVIISDDASKDNTLKVCKDWKEKNKNKYNIILISSNINQGVVKNINQGVKLATGEWIKILAGDDILEKNALQNYSNFIKQNKEAEIIFSKVRTFGEVEREEELPKEQEFYKKNSKEQIKILLEANQIYAPGVILKKSLLEKMEYFDERFKMVEDYPFWIKLLKNKIKFYFLDKVTVFYRINEKSVSSKKNNLLINPIIFEFEKQFFEEIYKKEIKNPLKLWDKFITLKRREDILKKGNRKKTKLYKILGYCYSKKILKYILRILIIFLIIVLGIKK
ncbi:glycosyltransferase [Fusobacterium sp.]|uniref:glycosyltransferase n=1 Tax=Fusobacterium sp. TaxID=68766 RepID=UPI002603BA24|nr:glycosyltransferase [Fusobacterium sp.]